MRTALAWQPGLTYGNRLTVIINNQKKKKNLTNNTCKTLPRLSTGNRGKTHTYTNRGCLPCARAHTDTYTHEDKCTHTDAYWLNRKTSFQSVACKSISLPTRLDGNKTLSCLWFRGFLHLVVAVEMDTPSHPPLPHTHTYMRTYKHQKWTGTTKAGCCTRSLTSKQAQNL